MTIRYGAWKGKGCRLPFDQGYLIVLLHVKKPALGHVSRLNKARIRPRRALANIAHSPRSARSE